MHDPRFLDHFKNPRHEGLLADPDTFGTARFDRCGDRLTLHFRLHADRVEEVCFQSSGCGMIRAAASAATELLCGRSLTEARSLTSLELDRALGGVPPAKRHALWMVLECLAEALGPRPQFSSALSKARSPEPAER